jgi:membrane-associated phospholipid phosphatase
MPDVERRPGSEAEERFVGTVDLTEWHSPPARATARSAKLVAQRIGSTRALILTLGIGIIPAVLLVVLFAWIYDAVAESDSVAGLDHPVLAFAMSLRSAWLDTAVHLYTDIGGTIIMPIIAVGAMVLLAVRRRAWTPVILITAAGTGSLLMTIFGKLLFGRARPPLVDQVPPLELGASFPSGHTLNSIVIAGIIAYLLVLRQKSVRGRALTISVATLFTLTIGLSRVFLGAHWFTDVLGAWAIGGAWLALVITAHRLYLTTRLRH